jgi:hypothetical protein
MRIPRRGIAAFLFPALLLIIFVGFFWKLVLTDQFTWLENPDMAWQVMPWLNMQSYAWRHAIFPAWDPYLYCGQPLVGQAQPGAVYPPNWLLFLMPLGKGQVRFGFLHWYFVLIHCMGGLFCYWLCRDLKRSRGAAMVGGIAYGLGGAMGAIGWPQILNSAVWTPLVVMFQLRALRGRRPWTSASLSGVCLGMAWLSGHHQIPTFVTLVVAAIWLSAVFRRGWPNGHVVKLTAVSAAFTVLVGAMQILPAVEYGRYALRWAGPGPLTWDQTVPYTVHRQYSADPMMLPGIVIPGLGHETSAYVGFAIAALAALAVAVRWREPVVRLMGWISLAGLFLALGPQGLIQGVLYAVVPVVEKARIVSMVVVVFSFGVAVLAAYGVDSMLLTRAAAWRKRLSLALALAGGTILLTALGVVIAHKMSIDFDQRVVLAGFMALLVAALLFGARRRTAFTVAVILLALIELSNSTGFALAHRADRGVYLRELTSNNDIVDFLKRQPGVFRVEVDDQDIAYSLGDWQRMEAYSGDVPSALASFFLLEPHKVRTRMMFGVRYSLRRNPSPDVEGQREVFQGATGVKVYENPQAFPRVWVVHEAVPAGHGEIEIRRAFHNPAFDPRRCTFVPGEVPHLETCGQAADEVRVISRGLNDMVFEANLGCRGMVVASDNYFPGWRATVDGHAARIYPAFSALRGVIVEGGRHHVEMHYRPASLYWGAVLAALGFAGAFLLAYLEKKREARKL